MKNSKYNPRIKKVFENCLKNVEAGNEPNVSGEMRKAGYAETSCRALKVTQTKPWKELLDEISNDDVKDTLVEIMNDKSDKRARLDAVDKIAKMKGLYADKKVNVSLQDEREEVFK